MSVHSPDPLDPASPGTVDKTWTFGEPVSEKFSNPAGYQADDDLRAAVEVALLLGMPLLLTGEPGCGKTSVAAWLAWRMKLGKPRVFNVKSTSVGRDLLYEFDELARFRDAQARKEQRGEIDYVRLNALGLAIALASMPMPKPGIGATSDTVKDLVKRSTPRGEPEAVFGSRQVVLIDELDKAPRDTPNDLLLEILEMKFHLRELDIWIGGLPELRPVVVITSNSEKSLPEPFLRRCVFHHIKSPDDATRRQIIASRRHPFVTRRNAFDLAMRLFERLASELGRTPGTAELLAWLTVLESRYVREPLLTAEMVGISDENFREEERRHFVTMATGSLSTLAKTTEDLARAQALLREPMTE